MTSLKGTWVRHKFYSMGIICNHDLDTNWLTIKFLKDNTIMRLSARSKQITFIK